MGGSGGGGRPPGDAFMRVMEKWHDLSARLIKAGCPEKDIEEIERSFHYAYQAHIGQLRRSGEEYIYHCLEVGLILIDLMQIIDMIAHMIAQLHDVWEDTYVSLGALEEDFGPKIASLVIALSKFPKTQFTDQSLRTEENRKRLFSLMTKDVRIALVKLADRLHNMRTLRHMSPARRKRIALETLEFFVPLADVLGVWVIKRELEDLSFMHLFPREYNKIKTLLEQTLIKRSMAADRMVWGIQHVLNAGGFDFAEVAIKPRTVYSFYDDVKQLSDEAGLRIGTKKFQDLLREKRPLMDLDTMTIVVETKEQCYAILNFIKKVFPHVDEATVKDYINMPRFNFYRSVNISLEMEIYGNIRIKIRTRDMEKINDRGIAEIVLNQGKPLPPYWVDLLEYWRAGINESNQVSSDLKRYLDLIMVFTPDGEPIVLPKGSTAVDFAFAVHTDLGLKIGEAFVKCGGNDKRKIALKEELKDGDTVFIGTRDSASPRRMIWSRAISRFNGEAKRKVRRHLEGFPRKGNVDYGRRILNRVFRTELGVDFTALDADVRQRIIELARAKIKLSAGKSVESQADLFWYLGILAATPEEILSIYRSL